MFSVETSKVSLAEREGMRRDDRGAAPLEHEEEGREWELLQLVRVPHLIELVELLFQEEFRLLRAAIIGDA